MAKSQSNGTDVAVKKNKSVAENSKKSSTSKNNSKTLNDLFEEELKDMYNAEQQLIEALPKMVKAAYSEDLQDAFENHLQETKRHAERIEKIFERLHINKNEEEKCEAMEGLIQECKQIISEFEESPVRDSALIICAQKVEHYEIASYGSLCELADVLGYSKIVEILDHTLEEEEMANKNLTDIACDVNDEAYELSEQEELV